MAVKKIVHDNKKYTASLGDNGYPVVPDKVNKPTLVRGCKNTKKGKTAHGPMG